MLSGSGFGRRALRACALAAALALAPACALVPLDEPIVAAERLDHRAYALIATYAAALEEAADIVADPAVPHAVKRALGKAEAAASQAVAALETALAIYVRTRNGAPLVEATARAEASVARFSALVRSPERN